MTKMAEKKAMNFEDAMARLEEILQGLESGEGTLDELLKLYEEGVALIRVCNDRLEKAEQSVKMLQINADGTPALVDFRTTEDL